MPTTDEAMIAVPRFTTSHESRVRTVRWTRLVDVAVARTGEAQDVLARLFLTMWTTSSTASGRRASRSVHDGGGNQRVLLEAQRALLPVHRDGDQGLVALHHIGQRDAARRAQDP
jgi:hypothetical protein